MSDGRNGIGARRRRHAVSLGAAAAFGVAVAAATAPSAAELDDRSAITSSLNLVLESEQTGTTHVWHNPSTGHSGTITITRTRYRDGKIPCRDYRVIVDDGSGVARQMSGTGCRAGRGSWVLNGLGAGSDGAPVSGTPTVEEIRTAQQRLSALGYGVGPADGVYGPRTRRAIESFQRDNGLAADGRVSTELLAALPTASPRPAPRSPRTGASAEGWDALASVHAPQSKSRPLDAKSVYRRVNESVWVVVAARSRAEARAGRGLALGSAVAVDASNLLTNCHIIKRRPLIAIIQNEDVRPVRVVSADFGTDRCILAVDDGGLQRVPGVRPFDDLDIGEATFTVGSPSGLERTLGEGIVSGLRSVRGVRYVQTTAPISEGSSGGGLFDAYGNLIGITTQYVYGGQALNFAIAAEEYWR